MAVTYLAFIHYTQEGMHNIKDSPSRLDAARKAFKAFGGDLKEWFLLFGSFDALAVCEAPDDATMAKLSLMISQQGSVRIESMKAFTEDEYRKIIAGLG